MGSAVNGAKAGVIAGVVYGIVLGILSYFTVTSDKSLIISSLTKNLPANFPLRPISSME